MNIKGSNHLTLAESQKIREMLEENEKCKTIATVLLKDERTISREAKKEETNKKTVDMVFMGRKTIAVANVCKDSHSFAMDAINENLASSNSNFSMSRA